MVRWRTFSGLVTLALLAALGPVFGAASAGQSGRVVPRSRPDPPRFLEIYYSSPVLARAGERVRIPVDVVCATAAGRACSATVTLGTRVAGEPWKLTSSPAVTGLAFDVTRAAARAAALDGAVQFFLRARDASGRTASLPATGPERPLRFFVVRRIHSVRMPAVRFGAVRPGTAVLSLPWGSGPVRAGLQLGRESATRGPSAFGIDGRGRISVMDSLQRRLGVFAHGHLVASRPVRASADAALAINDAGGAVVASRDRGDGSARAIQMRPSGEISTFMLGPGVPSQVRSVGRRPFVRLLPLDAWVSPSGDEPLSGMPLTNGRQLLRVGREDRIRLGVLVHGRVTEAMELIAPTSLSLGDVALAEVDGHGGYWLVVRVGRTDLGTADQYEAVHLARNGRIRSFGIASHSFAESPPQGRMLLGPDGGLYQMTSSPDGLRIVRFDLAGGER